MTRVDLLDALNDSIDMLNQGAALETCLARYPEHASELRSLLQTGLRVKQSRVPPSAAAAARERVRGRFILALYEAPLTPARRSWRASPVLALVASLVLVFGIVLSGALRDATSAQSGATLTATAPSTAEPTELPVTEERSHTQQATATGTQSPTPTGTPTPLPPASPTATATVTLTPEVCLPGAPDGWTRYQVRQGDTLSGLAASGGTTVARLMEVNCLPASGIIVIGQELLVPAATLASPPSIPPSDSPGSLSDNDSVDNDNGNDDADSDDNDNLDDENDNLGDDNDND
jgi:LysM repeat protein